MLYSSTRQSVPEECTHIPLSVRVRDRGNITWRIDREANIYLEDRSSGLVRPNTHAEELLYVVYWVPIPDGVGVDRGFKEGFLF